MSEREGPIHSFRPVFGLIFPFLDLNFEILRARESEASIAAALRRKDEGCKTRKSRKDSSTLASKGTRESYE